MGNLQEGLFKWDIKDGKLKLLISNEMLSQMIIEVLECDEIEFQEYKTCLEKDVIISLLAETVENTLDQIQNGNLNRELLKGYFYTYEDFGEGLKSILECYEIDEKKITEYVGRVFEVCDSPNEYIIKQLMMIYCQMICKGFNVSKKELLAPLTNKSLKLKKVRNKYLKFNKLYWNQKDYKVIMDKQLEFTTFLENLQMNGTYEQLCHKSLNLYYYNLFSRMVDLALFTEVICSTSRYIKIFTNAPWLCIRRKGN